MWSNSITDYPQSGLTTVITFVTFAISFLEL